MGTPGVPVDRGHPFYFGFLAAAGAVIAVTVLKAFASASQVFVLIIISLFLAAGLNPSVATVVDAHEILVMDAGRIVERGNHAQLLAANGRYAAMWAQASA